MKKNTHSLERSDGTIYSGTTTGAREQAMILAGAASDGTIGRVFMVVQRCKHIKQERLNDPLAIRCIPDAVLRILQTARLTIGSHGHLNGLRNIPIWVVAIEFVWVICIHAAFVGSPDENFRVVR